MLNDVSYDFHPKLSDFMWVDEQHTNMHAVGVSKPYPKKWYMLCGLILPCKAAMAAMGRVQFFSLVATKNLHQHNERNETVGPWYVFWYGN